MVQAIALLLCGIAIMSYLPASPQTAEGCAVIPGGPCEEEAEATTCTLTPSSDSLDAGGCTPIPGTECQECTTATTCTADAGECTVASGSGTCTDYTAGIAATEAVCDKSSGSGSCTYTPPDTPISNYKIAFYLQLVATLLFFATHTALKETGKLSGKIPPKAGACFGAVGLVLALIAAMLMCAGDEALTGSLSGHDLAIVNYLSYFWLVVFGLQTLSNAMSCATLAKGSCDLTNQYAPHLSCVCFVAVMNAPHVRKYLTMSVW